MTAENGTFTVKGPAGDQVLHRACVVTRTARQTFIGLMCLLYLFPVQFHAQTGRIRTAIFPFLISSGFLVRRQSPSCQIQWVSIAVGLPGAAAPTWVNIAREISKWLLEWQPGSAPVVAKLRHADCTGKRPEVRIGKWNIYRIEHHRMTHFAPVGGDHVGRDGQAGRPSKLRHHFTTGETLLSAARVFRIGKDIIQPFAQRNGFIKQPGTIGINGNPRIRKRFFNARTVSISCSPGNTPPLSLKSLKP